MKIASILIVLALLATESSAQISVSLPTVTAYTNDIIEIPVTVGSTDGQNIIGYQFAISFDKTVVTPLEIVTTGTLSGQSGWTALPNILPDSIKVGGFGASPLTGSGVLVKI